DVFTCAVGMKKSRSGVLLTIICHPDKVAACERILFRETTTLGIRRRLQERSCLPRELHTVETELGPIRVKVAYRGNSKAAINVQPEYEDCAKLARESDRPWQEVWDLALAAWEREKKSQE
ncbi:MAG: nickel insertion protein, partial [Cyanobacteria bacterium J06641_5]